ncbi:hypothetical protein OV913_25615, partial [Salmonella enterica subsp. enterica serovar 1,4,[5],12:i:-]|nr:hypothetical protein [Salmonella enterica subsp. enterica serovar 1,4,[5],12:i:-]
LVNCWVGGLVSWVVGLFVFAWPVFAVIVSVSVARVSGVSGRVVTVRGDGGGCGGQDWGRCEFAGEVGGGGGGFGFLSFVESDLVSELGGCHFRGVLYRLREFGLEDWGGGCGCG